MPNPQWARERATPEQESALQLVEAARRAREAHRRQVSHARKAVEDARKAAEAARVEAEPADEALKTAVLQAKRAGVESTALAKIAGVGNVTIYRWLSDSAKGEQATSDA
jgi:multidrug efflux pump subunit AcrA (membrane-fusion protein)